ncbi:hypothetical protein FIBSPDRAFT_901534 [Athelia psychrophila]|uniref:Uncharacterized protein n=1 Tax=Athelia psychrophila TaxID=1759441 RepID=A0A165X0X8_9AGAM|nr:hypothetical protein FIBSPDRAFT_901534 [Fibularhizoctonia sp. CBS 109695]
MVFSRTMSMEEWDRPIGPIPISYISQALDMLLQDPDSNHFNSMDDGEARNLIFIGIKSTIPLLIDALYALVLIYKRAHHPQTFTPIQTQERQCSSALARLNVMQGQLRQTWHAFEALGDVG